MQYLGGKSKIGATLANVIKMTIPRSRWGLRDSYVEPFCGALGVTAHVGFGVAADIDPEMVALWRAVQNGWRPPREVSEALYNRVRDDLSAAPELRGFVKHACSFAGKAWNGYARDPYSFRNYALTSARWIAKTAPLIRGVEFVCSDYRALSIPEGCVVYCDPPYAGTTPIKGEFDSVEFWSWAESISTRCSVLVSEYAAPNGWREVWAKTIPAGIRQGLNAQKTRAVERLFILKR